MTAPVTPSGLLAPPSPGDVLERAAEGLQSWLGDDWRAQALTWLVTKPLAILLLVAMAVAARWFLHRLVDRLVRRAADGLGSAVLRRRPDAADAERPSDDPAAAASLTGSRRVQRAETMGSLLKSIASIVVFTVLVITVIAELGYPVGPLIASAGIAGVALGFGAQSLVKDFISGIFMIFEDQYGVGDVVDLGEAGGTVEAVGLRVTRLRDVEGTVWYVRNGEILRVGNKSQNWARTVLDIPVALDSDLRRVQEVLREVAHELWEDEDYRQLVIEEPEVWGVEALTPSWVVVRVTLKTAPLEQWAVAREMRQRVKARFDAEGIEIAPPTAAPWGTPA
ncbi:MAG TPA: mechanosensitive ion channel family protein [Nocardioidaceae bacterium]|nr:mechanosensitive ion channel family protein [Nocardioidaceae bacterium]